MWDIYGVCECGFHTPAPFGRKFHILMEVCPECGTPKAEWRLKTARFISTSIWWKPNTWGNGYWEYRDGYNSLGVKID